MLILLQTEMYLKRAFPGDKMRPTSTEIMDVTLVIQHNRYILEGEGVSLENHIK